MLRTEWAELLTRETGFTITVTRSCFTLDDGESFWFPLYTVADVRMVAAKIKARRAAVVS